MKQIVRSLVLAALLAAPAAPGVVPGARAQLPDPCGTVTDHLTLAADCLGPLTVAADGVRLDLGGHRVLCLGGGTGIEVSGRERVRVRNGQVSECGVAVRLQGGGGHTLTDLVVTSGPGAGIVVEDSDHNTLRHLLITGVRGFGLEVSGVGNRVEANQLSGIVSQGGTAIRLLDGAVATRVRLNLVQSNAVGIQVGGRRNIVHRNDANRNQVGISVEGRANLVRANVADDNGIAGLVIAEDGVDNILRGNRAGGNAVYDLADFPPGACTENTWARNEGERLLDGCEAGATHKR
jgi:hypothetical protein